MRSRVITAVKAFRWQQWLVLAVFLLITAFSAFKALHTARDIIYWRTHRDAPIRGWMNIGYLAHSYRVPQYLRTQDSANTEQTTTAGDRHRLSRLAPP